MEEKSSWKKMDYTNALDYEFGVSPKDQADIGIQVGSQVGFGKTVFAGLPAFRVTDMNDKTVTLEIGTADSDKKILRPEKGGGYSLKSSYQKRITIPRWQYEKMITRGLEAQPSQAPPPL